jgi:hypothetical protein
MAWKYDRDKITYFAETDFRGQRVKFGIREEDRARHMYIIGKTGMGKSTLLENLAIQDIQNDEGMCFIDPHGGTAEALLSYVPEHRIKDVVYFAPHEMEWPVALNVLENDDPNKRPLIASGILSTFKKVWPDAWSGRMEYFLMNTLLALLETPGSTLLGVNRMYSDAEYREKVIANVTDTSVRAFWVDEYANMTEKMVAEATPAIQNKVGQFSMNPIMRNILGQSESTFDIRWLMDNRKIFIVNLSKGRVGETNAALLGALLVTKIYLAAMSRADMNDADLKVAAPFHLYVDEFQNFANDSFANILSEARKYKLALTIAHQYIEQMPEEVRNAVFGNVGTMITFRIGAGDAEVLEKEFAPVFTMEDIVGLGFGQIYLKLMIKGAASVPFSARTYDRPPMPTPNFAQQVVDASREQFSRPRADVEEIIKEWFTTDTSKKGPDDGRPGVKKFAPGQRPPMGAGGARSFTGAPRAEQSAPGQVAEGQSLASALAKAGLASKQAGEDREAAPRRDESREQATRPTPRPLSRDESRAPASRPMSRPLPPRTQNFTREDSSDRDDRREERREVGQEVRQEERREEVRSDRPAAMQAPQPQVTAPQPSPQMGHDAQAQYPYGGPQGYAPQAQVYPPQPQYQAPAYYPPQAAYHPPQYQAPTYPHYPYPVQQYGYPQPHYYQPTYYPQPAPMYPPQPAPIYQPYPPTIHYGHQAPPAPQAPAPAVPVAAPAEVAPAPIVRMPQAVAERSERRERVEEVRNSAKPPERVREETRPRQETRPERPRREEVVIDKSPREVPRAPISEKVLSREEKPRTEKASEDKQSTRRNDGKGPSEEKLDALAAALARLSQKPEPVTVAPETISEVPKEIPKTPSQPVPIKPQAQSAPVEVKPSIPEVPLDVLKKILE